MNICQAIILSFFTGVIIYGLQCILKQIYFAYMCPSYFSHAKTPCVDLELHLHMKSKLVGNCISISGWQLSLGYNECYISSNMIIWK